MISSSNQKRLIALAKKIIIRRGGHSEAAGVACKWIKIAESWGVKFSRLPMNYISQVFKNQRRGWRFGLAPYCFGIFSIEWGESTLVGYITQIAKVASNVVDMFYSDLENAPIWMANKIKKIVEIIKKCLNFVFWDCHAHNIGILNGKVVVIDWGDENAW